MSDKKISSTIDIYNLESLSLKIYWVLDFLTSKTKDRFTLLEIFHFLIEEKGINITKSQIYYALKNTKEEYNKNKDGYKLMEIGREKLKQINNLNHIILIKPNKPYSGKRIAAENMFSKMQGSIRMCDPYFTIRILDNIYNFFGKDKDIQILTTNIHDKPKGNIARGLQDLRKEGYKVEVKIYQKSELHDRYIIDDKNIWLSGYGFNDIGKKECFFVLLGEDFRQSILTTFNNRWKVSNVYR